MVSKIVVAAVTRGRPKMFCAMLDSLAKLVHPEGVEVSFCFVENDDKLSIARDVEAFARDTGYKAVAICEPVRGIPFARNAALSWALKANAEHLAFIDDDELAHENWLIELFSEHQARMLDLTGGPVVPVGIETKLSFFEKITLRGVQFRARRIARTNALLRNAGHDGRVTIVTSNWLCRLAFIRHRKIEFDEELGYSGGSDAALYHGLKRTGGKTGWAPNAIVMEAIPLTRLTLRYQFHRGRDQAISSYRIRYSARPTLMLLFRSFFFVLSKSLLGAIRLTIALFDGGRSLALALRAFGFAWGRILALLGRSSQHYRTTHGN